MRLTFQLHPNAETFLEPTIRATLPLSFINLAALIFYACVPFVVLDCSLKEPLQDRYKVFYPSCSADWFQDFISYSENHCQTHFSYIYYAN